MKFDDTWIGVPNTPPPEERRHIGGELAPVLTTVAPLSRHAAAGGEERIGDGCCCDDDDGQSDTAAGRLQHQNHSEAGDEKIGVAVPEDLGRIGYQVLIIDEDVEAAGHRHRSQDRVIPGDATMATCEQIDPLFPPARVYSSRREAG